MTPPNVTVLGIGNVLWADEGFGMRAIELLNRRYRFPENVQLIDGGTQGIYLVQHVQAAELLGDYPDELLLIGVQPEELEDYGGSLRPSVRAQLTPATNVAMDWLSKRGVFAQKRIEPPPDSETLNPSQLELTQYETGRPNAALACRKGDDRILRDVNLAFDPEPLELEFDEPRMSVSIDHRNDY